MTQLIYLIEPHEAMIYELALQLVISATFALAHVTDLDCKFIKLAMKMYGEYEEAVRPQKPSVSPPP